MSKQGDRNITERRRVVLRAAAGALVLPWAGGTAFAQQKIICRIAPSEAVGSPLSDAFEKWAGILRERSGGRIDAQHFPVEHVMHLALGTSMATIVFTSLSSMRKHHQHGAVNWRVVRTSSSCSSERRKSNMLFYFFRSLARRSSSVRAARAPMTV